MIRQPQRETLKRPNTFLCRESDEPPEKIVCLNTRDRISATLYAASGFDTGRALYDHFKSLKEDMEALEVATLLKNKGVLDASSHQTVVSQQTRRRRVDALVKALHNAISHKVYAGNVQAYKQFLDALSETGQAEIRTLLQQPVTHYRPDKHETESLLKMFTEKKKEIMNEAEPLDIIDDIVLLRGLHFHDHEEIVQAKCRKERVDLLNKHLKSLGTKHSWRILKPISEKYKRLFTDSVGTETSVSKLPDASSSTGSSIAKSASASSSEESGASMALRVNFTNIRKSSIAVSDTTEHDHPTVKLSKLRDLEKRVVDNVGSDPEKYRDIYAKLMDECTSSLNGLSFSSIRIHLQALSETSIEQLKDCCQDGRAKSWILSMLDEDSVKELKELEATRAELEIYVDEREDFLNIFDEVDEGCLCTLNKNIVECNSDYVVENIENLEVSFINKVLKSSILQENQVNNLLKIKDCVDDNERKRKLIGFLLKENTCQTMFCLLEEEIIISGKAEVIIRLQQTKPCRISNESKNTASIETSQITGSDLREHSEMLEDEIDARWFVSHLQSRSDTKSTEMLNKIQESSSRIGRTKPFLDYIYDQDDLHWFSEVLATHHKHLLDILKRVPDNRNPANVKLAFMSAYDAVIEDIEPLCLVKQLTSSFLQEIDIASLKDIGTRQGRASFFIRKVLGGRDTRLVEVLEAMRSCYGDVVTTIEKILESGSLSEKYKCPRIRRVHGKSPMCVFSTEISLFEPDMGKSDTKLHVMHSVESPKKSNIAPGFVEAEITKYDKNIKHERDVHWASYDRYNTNIGVIGAAGSCKQSLLHDLCGRIETDEETAQIYVETDMKRFGSYKEARKATFWDLPEIGTEQFPRETYLKDIDFKRYDCFVMVVRGKFEIDNNIAIAKELAHLHRKVLLISTSNSNLILSTHVELPVAHCSSATTVSEKQVVETVRQNYYKDLKELGCGEATLFLINEDAILSSDYDFDKLITKLTEEVAEEKHTL